MTFSDTDVDPKLAVAVADRLREWFRREEPDAARLLFNADFEELAMIAVEAVAAAGRLLSEESRSPHRVGDRVQKRRLPLDTGNRRAAGPPSGQGVQRRCRRRPPGRGRSDTRNGVQRGRRHVPAFSIDRGDTRSWLKPSTSRRRRSPTATVRPSSWRGITGCPDWQAEAHRLLADLPVAILNPRRADFPIHDPTAAEGQIAWEFRHLQRASVVLFWFPDSGPVTQPIALYELGAHAAGGKLIAVGTDPGYVRRADVDFQLGHVRPGDPVWNNLPAVCRYARMLLTSLPAVGGHQVKS